VFGPINVVALKDWQTLMATFVAVGAATLGYRGAYGESRFRS
jgi:hypothetical protein